MKHPLTFSLIAFVTMCAALRAQEQIDNADARGKGSGAVNSMSLRVRVTRGTPALPTVRVSWRRGGEGLGGSVVRGELKSESGELQVPMGAWTAWHPMRDIAGHAKSWEFPTLVVTGEPVVKGRSLKPGETVTDIAVDFEIADSGKTIQRFTEVAPRGSTVGFASNLSIHP